MRRNHDDITAVVGEEEIRSPPCLSAVSAAEDGGGGRSRKKSSCGLKRMMMKVNKESMKWWGWKYLSSAFRRKRSSEDHLGRISLVDDVIFKVVSAVEAVVLVAAVSFFYLCCGCHF